MNYHRRNLNYLASLCIYFLKIYISPNHTKYKMKWYSNLILEGEKHSGCISSLLTMLRSETFILSGAMIPVKEFSMHKLLLGGYFSCWLFL